MNRILIISTLAVLFVPLILYATIINIPADYPTIQQGIDASSDGDTVLVQPGTYVENINFSGHNIVLGSLFLTTGDTSYIEQTVIDGDSAGSVVTFESRENENSRITGFTIQNGYASGYGGGIRIDSMSNPVVCFNNITRNNSGDKGGGIACIVNSNATISDNYFNLNIAEFGGAIYAGYSDPLITNNIIRSNEATWGYGGGIDLRYSNALIENNTIQNNTANYHGGGIYCRAQCAAIIRGNIIKGNSTNSAGGGIHLFQNNRVQILGNRIEGNFAPNRGGGLYFYDDIYVKVIDNFIADNSSDYGAGIYLFRSRMGPNLHNNTIANNEAAACGGGIYCEDSDPIIINNVLVYNRADSVGGGVFIEDESLPVIRNCILWNDSSAINDEIYCDNSSTLTIEYCDIENGWPGPGNIAIDPLFRNPANDDFHLMYMNCGDSSNSPCVDAGDPSLLDSLLDCNWGLGADVSDIGAYAGGETVQGAGHIINVPADFNTIQTAINASIDGDTVLVQPGNYQENINFNGHNILLTSLFLLTGDTTYISITTIDGRSVNTVVTFDSGEDSSATLTGFTIKNGDAQLVGGGGIYCYFSHPTISHNIIKENEAILVYSDTSLMGGGIYAYGSDASICNNIISDNISEFGAGIYCANSYGKIISNIIRDNIAEVVWSGGSCGGLTLMGGEPIVRDNLIFDNDGGITGGGIYCGNTDALIVNNNIYRNIAEIEGGGIVIRYGFPKLVNNVIYDNSANDWSGGMSRGGGIVILFGAFPTLINNVLWGDSADYNHEIHMYEASAIIEYSDIQGGWPGVGNIDIDPLFRDPSGGYFHLMAIDCGDSIDSPCIDAGSPYYSDSLLDCSWGLGTSASDMGAYGGGDTAYVGIWHVPTSLPDRFMLSQNYPNPFNAQTTIRFTLPESQNARLTIYDLLGRQVKTLIDEYIQAGVHIFTFDASHLSSGVYFYRLQAGDLLETKRMVLLK